MLAPGRNRLTTCVLLAAYLAATTLGGLFHDHACEVHASCAAACQHDHDGHHDPHADDDVAGLGDEPADGNPLHDDACAICRFVGQRVMTVEAAELVRLCSLNVELPAVRISQPSAPLARTIHSRAPPLHG
jgi:hypothetical protein